LAQVPMAEGESGVLNSKLGSVHPADTAADSPRFFHPLYGAFT
jgi:hypothetical protein